MARVKMPDGKTVFFPDDMPPEQMKAAAQRYVDRMTPQVVEPQPDYWRGVAEAGGGALGVLATAPLTPVGQVVGGGLGAAMGGQAYDLISDLISGREDRTLGGQAMQAATDIGINVAAPAVAEPVIRGVGTAAKAVFSPIKTHLKSAVGPVGARTAQEISEMEAMGFRPEIGMLDTPEAQSLSQSLRNMPASSGVMAEIDRQNLQAGAQKAREIAESLGDPVGAEMAGEAVRREAARAKQRFFDVADSLYDKVAKFTGDSVPADNVKNMASDIASRASSSGIAQEFLSEPNRLAQIVMGDIAEDGTISVNTLRQIKKMSQPAYRKAEGLRTDADRFMMQLERAADSDLYNAAISSGGENARRAVDTAKNWWKAGKGNIAIGEVGHLDDIANIMKQTEDGKIIKWLRADEKIGADRLGRVLNFVDEDTAGKIRATAFMELGTPTAGQLGAGGDGFSFSTFLTNSNKLSDSAKTVLFGKAKKSYQELEKVAGYMKALQQRSNVSGTARANAFNAILDPLRTAIVEGASRGGLTGAIRGTAVGIPATLGNLALNKQTAKLISDPKFVKWLAHTGKKIVVNPTDVGPQIIRLAAIASTLPEDEAMPYIAYMNALGFGTKTIKDKNGHIKSVEVK